ncbi:hypothetical protein Taro_056209 [Colocasia esculenta]|uniref:Uncharacterized protein n=1 Tax=Colocasia esculenta TaxID=4460 RepID=A0A843XV40_COLES|nr:hypothetical protein [Colocasia esculenta]
MTIQVKVKSDKLVTPSYENVGRRTDEKVTLSIFDTVTYNTNFSVVFTFRAPTVSNGVLERSLCRLLAEYPEWAGRLAVDSEPPCSPVILLNDRGVRFIEATSDCALSDAVPAEGAPTPDLLDLHGDKQQDRTSAAVEDEPLLQVQLTRFSCGGLAVGLTVHHLVADGSAACLFWLAWGRAARGLLSRPRPTLDRMQFPPRNPLTIEFEHRGVEYAASAPVLAAAAAAMHSDTEAVENIVIHKARFSANFLRKLKAKASQGVDAVPPSKRPYSTFETLVAHLWRAVTRSRGLEGHVKTHIRISVDGRRRLVPPVPDEYFGNLVLWAFPEATVGELFHLPLHRAAGLIREAVAKVDDRYFRSFVDFSEQTSKVVTEERLVPTAEMENRVLSPHLEVDSWLRFPFYDVNFGSGPPDLFTPTWLPYEGFLVLLASPSGDGSVDVLVPLLRERMPSFKEICYCLD